MWVDVPSPVKEHSEMSFYSGYEIDQVYSIYGVDPEKGALAIVRPDGYVGVIASLTDVGRAEHYLEGLIRTV
jgi:phenol 2-monooxygenase